MGLLPKIQTHLLDHNVQTAYYTFYNNNSDSETYQHLNECGNQEFGSSIYKT